MIVFESPYKCTCDNDSPRWTRDNQCCPGCWQWSLDHHQDMAVNGVVPPTIKMLEDGQSHGINIKKLKELRAIRAHEGLHINHDFLDWVPDTRI